MGDDEETGGVEEGVRGEEDEFVGEDGAPDDGGEDPDSGLGDGGRACYVLGWGIGTRWWECRCTDRALGSSICCRRPFVQRRLFVRGAVRLLPRLAPHLYCRGCLLRTPCPIATRLKCFKSLSNNVLVNGIPMDSGEVQSGKAKQ